MNKATEHRCHYDRLPEPYATPLWQQLHNEFGSVDIFRRLFEQSKEASADLGRWASDMYWSFALRDEELAKGQSRLEKQHSHVDDQRSVAMLDAQIAQLQRACEIIKGHSFGMPMINKADLSSKVIALEDILREHYAADIGCRCIVFVNKRSTARLLDLVFKAIGPKYLRTAMLTGHNARAGDVKVSLNRQVLTLQQFRSGEANCLFATSVAEEGLDIPECNLVIRFDLYKTMIEYIQSKGRARHKNSKFIDMIERDNLRHREKMNDGLIVWMPIASYVAMTLISNLMRNCQDEFST